MVQRTLSGEAEEIKERTLGIEIFARDIDYETSSDPIVRVAAAEVRKRLELYYQEPGHEHELRISLPSGSYIPQFHLSGNVGEVQRHTLDFSRPVTLEQLGISSKEPTVVATPGQIEPQIDLPALESALCEPLAQPGVRLQSGSTRSRRAVVIIPVFTWATIALLSVGVVLTWQTTHHSAFDFFWSPVLTTSDPALLCVADQLQDSGMAVRDPATPSISVWLKNDSKRDAFTTVAIDDLNAIIEVAGVLQSSGKRHTVRGEGATSLADLRSGPTIFIGAFDNAWTLRLTNSLRFRFANDPGMMHPRIVDSASQMQTHWEPVQMNAYSYRDYAIVARFTDTDTGKVAIIIAGLGRCGTLAAGQFLTDTNSLGQLKRAAQAAGNKKNMEIVLSTQVINGEPGSSRIEGVYSW
ncbi:MAG: hypothetical protein P4L03_05550 [Terracidiphilus sp.]|nr:hypothetical protein [Terracidiphilus sp.]